MLAEEETVVDEHRHQVSVLQESKFGLGGETYVWVCAVVQPKMVS